MDRVLRRQMGAKLKNFREKLAIAINLEKINQQLFGQMFGGYSRRKITSYEKGTATMPADLLYLLWKHGNSIDGIFKESPISDEGRKTAQELYDKAKVSLIELINAADEKRRLKKTAAAIKANASAGIGKVKKRSSRAT